MTKDEKLRESNKKYYDDTYGEKQFIEPNVWPHWKLLSQFIKGKCLEIGSGTRPKIPVNSNYFIDISQKAVDVLNQKGGHASVSDLKNKLPYKSDFFDFVSAFELLEHLPNDNEVLSEMHRVLKNNGTCSISIPLHQSWFNDYDQIVGHKRRYEPDDLEKFCKTNGFRIVNFVKVDIIHANNFFAKFYPILYKHIPGLYMKLTNIFEGLRFVRLIRRKMELLKWDDMSAESLKTYCNTLLVLKKI
jgi:SAM-dependent methyltransferase